MIEDSQPTLGRFYELPLPNLMATKALAERIAHGLEPVLGKHPMTVALSGQLGAGKTQWIRFLCEHLGVSPEVVTSPTYVLLQRYRGRFCDIYHVDYYRLQHVCQVWDLGIDELQEQPVLILTEWADKFPDTVPSEHLRLNFELLSADLRSVRLTPNGSLAERVLVSANLGNL